MQCSDFTWQAYNAWPQSSSLYHRPDDETFGYLGPEVSGSFDRPYGGNGLATALPGTAELFGHDSHSLARARRVRRHVLLNLDLHLGRAELGRVGGFLSAGHDEYYTLEMYENLQAAIARGTNVAFLSGDTCILRVELGASSSGVLDRTLRRIDNFGTPRPEVLDAFPDMKLFPNESPAQALLIGARDVRLSGRCRRLDLHPSCTLALCRNRHAGGRSRAESDRLRVPRRPGRHPRTRSRSRGGEDPQAGAGRYTATVYPRRIGNIVFNTASIAHPLPVRPHSRIHEFELAGHPLPHARPPRPEDDRERPRTDARGCSSVGR